MSKDENHKKELIGWAYVRVSTVEQSNVLHGSVEQQQNRIKRWQVEQSQRTGIPHKITRFIEEDISGRAESLHKRREYHELTMAIRRRAIDFVVVEKLDRLHRDIIESRKFIDLCDEMGIKFYRLDGGLVDLKDRSSRAKALTPVKVLFLAGEEDRNEVTRRLQSVLRSMGIYENPRMLDLVNQNLRLFPRVGNSERLIDDQDNPTETFKKIKYFLKKHPDIKLVIVDPGSKYMGCETEKDAAKAQNWVDLLWQLSLTEGKPSVLVAHHTRKDGNKNTILKASEKNKAPEMDLDVIRGSRSSRHP